MSGGVGQRLRQAALAAAIVCWGGSALAANGFVSGTRVSRVGDLAAVRIAFNCNVNYLGHDPSGSGDRLRIQLEATSICSGVSPQAALLHERHRPVASEEAELVDIEYDGESPMGPTLVLNFSRPVQFAVEPFTNAGSVIVRVRLGAAGSATAASTTVPAEADTQGGRLVRRPETPTNRYVINLQSSLRRPTTADYPTLELPPGRSLLVSEALIDGTTWYRLRLGYFDSAESAARQLSMIRQQFPTAWIDRADTGTSVARVEIPDAPAAASSVAPTAAASAIPTPAPARPAATGGPRPNRTPAAAADGSELAGLMADARRAMTAGELSRAVQIYTKVLQQPESEYHPRAQEYLALARERNGQIAHAKAEYERYLERYPDNEGAGRVRQRLAALLANPGSGTTVASDGTRSPKRAPSAWTVRTFFSQYYRRDVNQVNDNDEIISQSALYSDVNVDARRRGERFDLSTRLSAGYRNSFLPDSTQDDRDLHLSYAYADLADTRLGLRGRLGRQSRNDGGVLGRFDGANLSYQATERWRFDAVVGKPVNSTYDTIDDQRSFYGASTRFGPIGDNLDLGVFFLKQTIEGMTDRQAVGGEFRYFGEGKSLWGLLDYDTSFQEIGSLLLQGSWRLPSRLTLTGSVDRRRSPFLSSSAAMIGQTAFADFGELAAALTEDEIRQLALDRAAATTTYSVGMSRPLSTKLQINLNASQTAIDASPESGGVAAKPENTYRYVSTDLVASSLLREGDVTLFRLRYSDSETATTWSTSIDSRYPIGRRLRINPRLRVDYRELTTDSSTQWTYTPAIRIQYRNSQKFRINLEAGKQFSSRKMTVMDENRESYFVNLGYQLFF